MKGSRDGRPDHFTGAFGEELRFPALYAALFSWYRLGEEWAPLVPRFIFLCLVKIHCCVTETSGGLSFLRLVSVGSGNAECRVPRACKWYEARRKKILNAYKERLAKSVALHGGTVLEQHSDILGESLGLLLSNGVCPV